MAVVAAALALPGASSAVGSCTITWTGQLDSNWHTVQNPGVNQLTNWNTNTLPTTGDVACIPSGTAIVESGIGASVAGFSIGVGATVNVQGNTELAASGDSANAGTVALLGDGAVVRTEDANPNTTETWTNSGTISFPAGGGTDVRLIGGDIINTGTVSVAHPAASYQQSRPGENRNPRLTNMNGGTINVASGGTFRLLDAELEQQTGGSITGPGAVNIAGASGGPTGRRVILKGGAISASTDVHLAFAESLEFPGPGSPTGKVRFPAGGSENFISGTVPSGFQVDVQGANAQGTVLTGKSNWTNNGTINVIGTATTLRTQDGDANTTETLTNVGTITVPAQGDSGARTIAGDIANSGTFVVADPGATFQQTGEARNPKFTNTGNLNVAGGGAFRFLDSALELQTGGTINGPGTINMSSGAFAPGTARRLILSGGTIAANADVNLAGQDTAIQFTGGAPTGKVRATKSGDHPVIGNIPSGITISLESLAGFTARLVSTTNYSNAGTIILDGSGTGLRTEDTVVGTTETLTNTGTINIPTGPAGERKISGDLLNQGGTITVGSADATFQQDGEDRNPKLTNAGTLTVSTGGVFRFLDSALQQSPGGTINGPGSVNVVGGSFSPGTARRLVLAGGTMAPNADVNLGSGDATLQITGGNPTANVDITGGTHALLGNVPTNATIDIEGTSGYLQSQTSFINNGTINLAANDAQLRTENANNADTETLTNKGTINFPAGPANGFRFIGGDLSNEGTINVSHPQSSFQTLADSRDPKLTNTATGTINVANGATFRLLTSQALTNAGTVQVTGVLNTNGVTQTAGTLKGTGTVGGNVTNSGGTVEPGASPGILTFTGTYTQGSGGTLRSEIQGTAPGTGYDRLAVSGAATLGGTLVVDGTGFTPGDTDTFDVLTASSVTGTFATTNGLGSAGSNKSFNVTYSAGAVRLTVNPAPPDADGDGVPDSSDACVNQSDANAQRNPRTGCPAESPPPPPADSDGDGVPDASDACPNVSDAPAQRNPRTGCPADAPPPADSDGDGVPDTLDPEPNNPNIPGPFGATNANDTLNGTAAGETICGLLGNDVINGGGGNDTLFGDLCNVKAKVRAARAGAGGNDTIHGNAGNDTVFGAGGTDKLFGDAGSDRLFGGDGNDALDGGAGNDKLNGGKGVNSYKGGAGDDTVSAKNGKKDTIDCGAGRKDKATVDKADKVKGCEKVKRAKK